MINFNKSFTYILPMLGNSINEFYNIRGCYIRNEDFKELDNHIFVQTALHNSEYFNKYEQTVLEKLPGYIKKYDPDNQSVIHIYELTNSINRTNYELFLQGKYSEFLDGYKKHIIKFHKLVPGDSIIGVLYKLEYRYLQMEKKLSYYDDGTPLIPVHIPRDVEISDPPYMERETFFENMKINDPFKTGRLNTNNETTVE